MYIVITCLLPFLLVFTTLNIGILIQNILNKSYLKTFYFLYTKLVLLTYFNQILINMKKS